MLENTGGYTYIYIYRERERESVGYANTSIIYQRTTTWTQHARTQVIPEVKHYNQLGLSRSWPTNQWASSNRDLHARSRTPWCKAARWIQECAQHAHGCYLWWRRCRQSSSAASWQLTLGEEGEAMHCGCAGTWAKQEQLYLVMAHGASMFLKLSWRYLEVIS